MTRVNAVGIDPGPIPGIVALQFIDRTLVHVDVIQCSASISSMIVDNLLRLLSYGFDCETLVQTEQFVVGRRSARSSTPKAGQITRELIGELAGACARRDVPMSLQTASRVKAWATNERLEAAGLLDATTGMRHAKDAARHALFAAVNRGHLPDPLSKEWKTL